MLLDLCASFNTVDHIVQIKRLRRIFRISCPVLQWIKSYLIGRSTRVLILKALDNKKRRFLSLLHLSASFNTVDHIIQIERLRRIFRISCPVLQWIKSNFTGRSIRALIHQHLLVLYHLYADDTQMHTSFVPRRDGMELQARNELEQCFIDVAGCIIIICVFIQKKTE